MTESEEPIRKPINMLKAVFWDYPQFTDEEYLREYLRNHQDSNTLHWVMRRFLEYGRVIDTLKFFSFEEIKNNFPDIQLRPFTLRKWQRLFEVYLNG